MKKAEKKMRLRKIEEIKRKLFNSDEDSVYFSDREKYKNKFDYFGKVDQEKGNLI